MFFIRLSDLQDQRGDHQRLWAGRGLQNHPLHLFHQHADEFHEELRRRRLPRTPRVWGEDGPWQVFLREMLKSGQKSRASLCCRPTGNTVRFSAWSRPGLPADEGCCDAHACREGARARPRVSPPSRCSPWRSLWHVGLLARWHQTCLNQFD